MPIPLYNCQQLCTAIWMRRSFAVVLAVVLLLLAGCRLPLAHANDPPAKIVVVHYPTTVQTGGLFTVRIQVAYSVRFGMMDVGIWDLGTGTVVQSLVTNATLSGPGSGEYSFSLKAPEKSCQWHLAAITRAWVQDAWFNDKAGEFDFSVQVAENGFLQLNGIQPNLTISVDGSSIVTNSSVMLIQLKLGIVHQVGVPQQIQWGIGRRLIFTEWSDGLSSNPRNILLAGNISIRPIYVTQYLLTVTSSMSVVAGAGWYREGEAAQFGIPTTVENYPSIFWLFTDSSQFTRWSGDSTSQEPTTTILMDGPKTVNAQWIHTSTSLNLNGLGVIFAVASLVLALRAGRLHGRRVMRHRKNKIIRLLTILSLISISLIVPPWGPVRGQLPVPVNTSVESIGGASWYYWNQPASDTCILWLGGGVEYSQGGYLLNPLEYESFGTIRFLQDLTKYYCLVALEKGPNPSPSQSNRTIYQELIQGQFSVARQLHQWIKAQGYTHIFMVGYSVGAEAAASIATSDPQTWTSSDGLILLTAWLPPVVVNGASSLRSNLMLLYGHAPTFEPTGLRFYQNSPSEGWHGAKYLHKEFHVLDQMGHEVWSPLKDNSYSPVALGITMSFIEASKALQFEQVVFESNTAEQGNWTYNLSQLEVPKSVLWGDPFFTNAVINSSNRSNLDGALAAYDFGTNRILSVTQFNGTSLPVSIRLNMPPVTNSSQSFFSLYVLEKERNEWKVSSKPYTVALSATDQILLRVGGLVPNSSFIADSIEYAVPLTGHIQLETHRGLHTYEVQRTVDMNNTRYFFVQWDDSNSSTERLVTLTDNTTINAIYRVQYFVSVVSQIGVIRGSGWYDANSSIEPSLQPIASNQPPLAFDTWTSGNNSFPIGDPIQVHSPMTVEAVWIPNQSLIQINSLTAAWVSGSALLFSILLILNVKLSRRKRTER